MIEPITWARNSATASAWSLGLRSSDMKTPSRAALAARAGAHAASGASRAGITDGGRADASLYPIAAPLLPWWISTNAASGVTGPIQPPVRPATAAVTTRRACSR